MQDAFSQTGVKEGDLLAGKYRIDKILGAGGMGVVVAAHHIHLDDRVAIKFLLPEALGNQEAVSRFAREARASVKIKSEHVVRVSDVGTLETGAPYMVMEFLEGGDLAAWLQQRGPLPVEQTVEFVLQACEAVAEAHALGIVHRDLKPANLFVLRRPDGTLSVKVLDFGISKVKGFGASGPDLGMTKTTAVMGSPLYMSPEQMQSAKDVDARADIWALGIILYELLSGVTPFEAESMPELVVKILQAPSNPLRDKRPDAPPGIETVIRKCLEKDRGKRYSTVGELANDLVQFGPKRSRASVERISGVLQAAGLSSSALALPPSSEGAERPASGTMAAWGQTSADALGGKRVLVGAAGAVAILLAILIVVFRGRSAEPPGGPGAASASIVPSSVTPPAALQPPTPPTETVPAPVPSMVVPAAPEAPSKAADEAGSSSASRKAAARPPPSKAPLAKAPPKVRPPTPAAAAPPRTNAFDDRK